MCKIFLCPNVSTTPLREWVLWQYLSFSWTTLRSTHCRRPIAVMGIVDTFQLYHFSIDTAIWLTFYQIILVCNHHWLNSITVLFGQHYRLKLFVQLWQILHNGPMISKWTLIPFSCFIVLIMQGYDNEKRIRQHDFSCFLMSLFLKVCSEHCNLMWLWPFQSPVKVPHNCEKKCIKVQENPNVQ